MDTKKLRILEETLLEEHIYSKIGAYTIGGFRFHLGYWKESNMDEYPFPDHFKGCSTVGCIAGMTVARFNPSEWKEMSGTVSDNSILYAAREELELDNRLAEILFNPNYHLTELLDYGDVTAFDAAIAVRNVREGLTEVEDVWAHKIREMELQDEENKRCEVD